MTIKAEHHKIWPADIKILTVGQKFKSRNLGNNSKRTYVFMSSRINNFFWRSLYKKDAVFLKFCRVLAKLWVAIFNLTVYIKKDKAGFA